MSIKDKIVAMRSNTDKKYRRIESLAVSLILVAGLMMNVVIVVFDGFAGVLNRPTSLIVILFSVMLFFIPIKPLVKGTIYCIVIAAAGLLLYALGNVDGNAQYIVALSIMVASLYNCNRILFIPSGVALVGTIGLIVLNVINMSSKIGVINHIVLLISVIVTAYFSIQWGKESLESAKVNEKNALEKQEEALEKEQQAQELMQRLQKTMKTVKAVAADVTDFSQGIASSSQSLSESTTQQAATLQEINASINDISGQAQLNEANVRESTALVAKANDQTKASTLMLTDMKTAMEAITESSKSISTIIKVIDDIAFQTNILALNAAVEAARAGEHGKGFAVVAEEVRNLAQKSAKAAKETEALIGDSQAAVNKGEVSTAKAAGSLVEIAEVMLAVNEKIITIADNSHDTVTAVNQINEAISQLAQALTVNSASAEDYARSSQDLMKMSGSLADIVR